MDSIDKPLDADWWRDQTILSTKLRDLVEGFDSISSFAVPYARLPRRLGAYAEEFPRWATLPARPHRHCYCGQSWAARPFARLSRPRQRRCGSTRRLRRPERPAPIRR